MKRTYLKFIITFIITTLIFSSIIVYAGTPSSWALAEVNEARNKGLVLPEADDNFQDDITRELFCKLVVNLVEQATDKPVAITIANPFEDTNSTEIIKAYQLGIVNGMSATEFGPELLITREQVAAMMMRAARKLDDLMGHYFTQIMWMGSPPEFADQEDISNWALDDIQAANHLNIMKGVGENKIDPKGNTTIEQSILLILRVYNEYLPLKENEAPEALPTGTFEFDIQEGTSIDIALEDIAYDPDGDSIRISGLGGNNTFGNMVNYTDYVTFTAKTVDEDVVSNWHVTVSDEVEQTQIDFIFNVIDTPNEPPTLYMNPPFTVNEGESVVISTTQVGEDPENDVLIFTEFVLDEDMTEEIGTGQIMYSLIGTPNSFKFTADLVNEDTNTLYNITLTDGTNEVVVPVSITVVNVNDPPVAKPMTTLHQDEGTGKIYWGMDVATDPDDDTLLITDFAVSEQNQHDIGTPEIRDFDGAKYFYFTADEVSTATWTYYDLTVTDGIHETIVTIRIQVDNLD